jgi:hypothetical protein
VLGVGALFLPWTLGGAHGRAATLGWGYDVLAGALLVVALALATANGRAGQGDGGLLALVRGGLGGDVNRAIRACYVVGITAGQAVVALVAAGFGSLAFGIGGTVPTGLLAASVLAVAVLVAGSGYRVPTWLVYPVFGLILLVTMATGLTGRGAQTGSAGIQPAQVAAAAVGQLFAVVGWESAGRIGRTLQRRRIPWLLGGVAIVGLGYGVALVGRGSAAGHTTALGLVLPDLGTGWPARVFAVMLMLVAALFCARNLSTATGLTAGLTAGSPVGRATQWSIAVVVGAGAMLGVVLVCAGRLSATGVLSVPNAAALTVFITAGAAAAALTSGWRRWCAVAAIIAYLPLLPFAGVAIMIPLLIFLATTARPMLDRVRLARRTADPKGR